MYIFYIMYKEFFEKHYIRERRSFPEIRQMLLRQGLNISVGTIYKYAQDHGVGRTRSEAKVNREENPLDYSKPILGEAEIEALDGFLLGDGSIDYERRHATNIARAKCGVEHQEFGLYLINHWSIANPSCIRVPSPKSPSGIGWQAYTKSHPDFYQQLLRWYPINKEKNRRIKEPPDDIRITSKSVMLWYLGDGSVVDENNSIALRLSTDGFSEKGVEFLVGKLREKDIDCHRNNDNRIYIEARGIPAFFKFIGTESPVKCYDYKFKLPEWRFASKRMRDVADELEIDYNRLAYLVKTGKVVAFRASAGGKPRFLPEHVEALKKMIETGEFDRDHRK